MHEMSLAVDLMELVKRYVPPSAYLMTVTVRIGPMHGVVAEALQWAWSAVRGQSAWPQAKLVIETPPWRLSCPRCGRLWEPATVDEHCTCGSVHADIEGGDEFALVSVEVADSDESVENQPRPEVVGHCGLATVV
ncbi:MAG: hydrogenase maturation nickel metallochaperone HypA [Phycisphaerales bacterium]|nr:hydrogenase maturation nickel metallochaperone HypA [Phycisphaerales bacterium]